jgi:hypothetical protein
MPTRRPRLPLTDASMDAKVAEAITVLQSGFDQVSIDVGNLKDGLIFGRRAHNAMPTWWPSAVGDIVINNEPEVVTTVNEEYILYGWVCTVASVEGAPGTWEELRFLSANITGGGGDAIYDIVGMYNGLLPDNVPVLRFPAVRAFTLPLNLTGSWAHCKSVATADASFNMYQDGSNIGTIEFASGDTFATFNVNPAITFAAGELFEIIAPSSSDPTLESISFCIKATR